MKSGGKKAINNIYSPLFNYYYQYMTEETPEKLNSSSTPLGEGLEQKIPPQQEGEVEILDEYQKHRIAEAKTEVLKWAAEGIKYGEILIDAAAGFMERAERMRETLEERYGRERLLARDNNSRQAQVYRKLLTYLDEARSLGEYKVSLQGAKEVAEKFPQYEIKGIKELGWLMVAGMVTEVPRKGMKDGIARINEMTSDLLCLNKELPPIELARE